MSLPSVVFASAFILLGWVTSHSVAYMLVGFMPHDHHEWHMHGYMDVLKLAGGCSLVLAFILALRSFFRYGSFGEWLYASTGAHKQVALVAVLPAVVFVLIEYLERLAAGTGTSPTARLLVVGVLVQLAMGLLCLALVRLTFHVVERVIDSIARRRLPRPARRTTSPVLENAVLVRPPCPMDSSGAGRAPPVSPVSI